MAYEKAPSIVPGAIQYWAIDGPYSLLSTILPLTRGNRTGAWAWQYSALLYCESLVSQPFLAHTRPVANRFDGRVMPLIAAPLTVSVILAPPGLGRHYSIYRVFRGDS